MIKRSHFHCSQENSNVEAAAKKQNGAKLLKMIKYSLDVGCQSTTNPAKASGHLPCWQSAAAWHVSAATVPPLATEHCSPCNQTIQWCSNNDGYATRHTYTQAYTTYGFSLESASLWLLVSPRGRSKWVSWCFTPSQTVQEEGVSKLVFYAQSTVSKLVFYAQSTGPRGRSKWVSWCFTPSQPVQEEGVSKLVFYAQSTGPRGRSEWVSWCFTPSQPVQEEGVSEQVGVLCPVNRRQPPIYLCSWATVVMTLSNLPWQLDQWWQQPPIYLCSWATVVMTLQFTMAVGPAPYLPL